MKIFIHFPSDKIVEERNGRSYFKIYKNDDKSRLFSVHDGESEDNSLNRNFSNVYEIPNLMKMAYEAGKNGEEFEIVDIEDEEDE